MIKFVIDSSSLLFILSSFIFVPMGGVTLRSGWSWDHPNLKKKKKKKNLSIIQKRFGNTFDFFMSINLNFAP